RTRTRIQDTDRVVVASYRQVPIATEGCRSSASDVAAIEKASLLDVHGAVVEAAPGGNLGEQTPALDAGGKEPTAVGAEAHRIDVGGARHATDPKQLAHERTGACIPQQHATVGATRGDQLLCRRSNKGHHARVPRV